MLVMEADWSVEVGPDAPHIVVPWADAASSLHFVDLRHDPDAANRIPEAAASSALLEALRLLNACGSAVFTSKCDVWSVPSEDLDPYALGLDPAESLVSGLACYIDALPHDPGVFASFARQEAWLRRLCAALRDLSCPGAAAELVLRPAQYDGREGYAVTLYVTAAGLNETATRHVFDQAMALAARTLAGDNKAAGGNASH